MPMKIGRDFGKDLNKSQFSQIFSKFTVIVEEVVCWCLLQILIHKVGFLSLSYKRRSVHRITRGELVKRSNGRLLRIQDPR